MGLGKHTPELINVMKKLAASAAKQGAVLYGALRFAGRKEN